MGAPIILSIMSFIQDIAKRYLSIWYPNEEILENYKPEWLCGLEMDFYLPRFNVAIEIQGLQHYVEIPKFHRNEEDFRLQLIRDFFKQEVLRNEGVTLVKVPQQQKFLKTLGHRISIAIPREYSRPPREGLRELNEEYLKYWLQNRDIFFSTLKNSKVKGIQFCRQQYGELFHKFIYNRKYRLAYLFAQELMVISNKGRHDLKIFYGNTDVAKNLRDLNKKRLQYCLYLLRFSHLINHKIPYYKSNPKLFQSCSFLNQIKKNNISTI